MTATAATRDRVTGRYTRRPLCPTCETCGWTLAENLLGGLYCPRRGCRRYRRVAEVVPGIDVGGLDAKCVVA